MNPQIQECINLFELFNETLRETLRNSNENVYEVLNYNFLKFKDL